MSPDDFHRIERELQIVLPKEYREAMSPFPVTALAGNSDLDVWDDAERLIAWNRDLRGGAPSWPSTMFAIGHAGARSCFAIDCGAKQGSVWWIDAFVIEAKESGVVSESFGTWFEDYVRKTREDCIADGIDPNESPALETTSAVSLKRKSLSALLVAGCIFALLVIFALLRAR